jgi:phage repressor protein C with HTH and peptisase S24 domain
MLKGQRQMRLAEAVQVADFLGLSPEEVLRHAGADLATAPSAAVNPPRRGRPPQARNLMALSPALDDEIPIRGVAHKDSELVLSDDPVGFTPRPANLRGVREAYAVYMVGDAMEPRYEQGWLLHVNPFKPPSRGRDVVVLKGQQRILIAQLVREEGDALVLRRFNPPEELRIRREDVLGCHTIVGVDQEA